MVHAHRRRNSAAQSEPLTPGNDRCASSVERAFFAQAGGLRLDELRPQSGGSLKHVTLVDAAVLVPYCVSGASTRLSFAGASHAAASCRASVRPLADSGNAQAVGETGAHQ